MRSDLHLPGGAFGGYWYLDRNQRHAKWMPNEGRHLVDVKADISARQLSIQLVPWPSVLAVLAVDASSRWGKKRRPFVSVLLRRSVVGLQQLLQSQESSCVSSQTSRRKRFAMLGAWSSLVGRRSHPNDGSAIEFQHWHNIHSLDMAMVLEKLQL